MIKKLFTPGSDFSPIERFGVCDKSAHLPACLHGTAAAQRIRLITHAPVIDRLAHMPVALIIVYWYHRAINRNLMKIGTTQPNQLGIGIGKEPPLQQGVV